MQQKWRLRSTRDFQRVRRDGTVYRHRFVLLSVAPNQLGYNRFGFVTAKHLGIAVLRNRIKRRLREVMRLLQPNLIQGYDMVVIARAGSSDVPFRTLQQIMHQLAQQAGLWIEVDES